LTVPSPAPINSLKSLSAKRHKKEGAPVWDGQPQT